MNTSWNLWSRWSGVPFIFGDSVSMSKTHLHAIHVHDEAYWPHLKPVFVKVLLYNHNQTTSKYLNNHDNILNVWITINFLNNQIFTKFWALHFKYFFLFPVVILVVTCVTLTEVFLHWTSMKQTLSASWTHQRTHQWFFIEASLNLEDENLFVHLCTLTLCLFDFEIVVLVDVTTFAAINKQN